MFAVDGGASPMGYLSPSGIKETFHSAAMLIHGDAEREWGRHARYDAFLLIPYSWRLAPVTDKGPIWSGAGCYYFGAEVGQSHELCHRQPDVCGAISRKSLISLSSSLH